MAERISAAEVRYLFSFVIAGDSGAWPDPTADAIFSQLLRQTADLRPASGLLEQAAPHRLGDGRGAVGDPELLVEPLGVRLDRARLDVELGGGLRDESPRAKACSTCRSRG